jgi:glutamate synthase domain-containing protein 2/glutamate synthase domain-containing protein 1/glutamate synthase domain-containing protein 3
MEHQEKSACGVGFLASRRGLAHRAHLEQALQALSCVEHRGACGADRLSSDGAGIMTDIPFELFGYEKGSVAIGTLFIPLDAEGQRLALKILADTFSFFGLRIEAYRDVPINPDVLGSEARKSMPAIKHVIIRRPAHCRTDDSFNKLLYTAKQATRLRVSDRGLKEFFFASLSTNTIVYKALTPADRLSDFYLDLQDARYKTRFAMFHRRFSTNTRTAWDKAQPFRLIAHNGEINTIAGNRSWGFSREQVLGLREGELLTHHGISDTGSLNEMVEALLYRSSIPHIADVLAILVPPVNSGKPFYKFWSRAMEPWDGPAFITFSDGKFVGARLDRNGFRPCRWAMTDEHFYLASEAGVFNLDESTILAKGTLQAGSGVVMNLDTGEIDFTDPADLPEYCDAVFDAHLLRAEERPAPVLSSLLETKKVFGWTLEDEQKVLIPMILTGKEPIGSMGDTARLAIFSNEPRSFFDYFYQHFAQVTNPPVDYIRETMVADLSVELGKKPNIFSTKELIPPPLGIELSSPVLSLGKMAFVASFKRGSPDSPDKRLLAEELDATFPRSEGAVGARAKLYELGKRAVEAVKHGASIIILSDSAASFERPPIPILLALRAVIHALNQAGLRLETSLVVHSGQVHSIHHLACLISFGAKAVCPYLALSVARFESSPALSALPPDVREKNLIKAFETGLLKVMSKMGISVVKSYQSSMLFSAIGLGKTLIDEFFPGVFSPIGGLEFDDVIEQQLHHMQRAFASESLPNTFQYKEHNTGQEGEKHSMTNARSKIIHKLVRENHSALQERSLYEDYLKLGEEAEPVNIRHLFDVKTASEPLPEAEVQSKADILKTFGSGAMSFGAISAEAQRDIFLAMQEIGGRSNSGEGGENPYYFKEGITAHTKQVASGRFGVTAEYLISGKEIQIKIAQGAKPGEGGQLMAAKVNADIAKARHSLTGIDLISPPPMHDIYSIEDLKELIYELRQVHPEAEISVKLVSGAGVGTIAVGVAKAGADIIHIAGGDGGTGAAALSSMKHAGLPWEIGLLETHRALLEHHLRQTVRLRTDGGLFTGKDIILAAILGAEEFDFGKLLLIAEGCVMARICEKNTCPTGIATHDPKFKAKYKGNKDHIVKLLHILADDVRRHLARIGVPTLRDLVGRTDLLTLNPRCLPLINERKLDLSFFFGSDAPRLDSKPSAPKGIFNEGISALNQKILLDAQPVLDAFERDEHLPLSLTYHIRSTDRAVLATLSGKIAQHIRQQRYKQGFASEDVHFPSHIDLTFKGSAGQGFGVFLTEGLCVRLEGEANDSVCKSMSGGKVVIVPSRHARFTPETNAIIGNCALYGATGGKLFVHGIAGDRFAVRNSGATAVVEGVGLHACEYMTNGLVVVLGKISPNFGAGMTGGKAYLYRADSTLINHDYLTAVEMTPSDEQDLYALLSEYLTDTQSRTAALLLENWHREKAHITKYLPIALAKAMATASAQAESLA